MLASTCLDRMETFQCPVLISYSALRGADSRVTPYGILPIEASRGRYDVALRAIADLI